ncbi:M56 family metallopeptidase [Paenibacillus silagei]|uniref:Beta-lactamase regulating signal transducer with metallopeptidase domain n=1 Tax=Paenibacillus silagei TaxID=1670801 RepID=A0ABS4NKC6_9BACL|nr:M56 family metallopeptidase [Paenibacillus silagei]MBP2110507.1 beta-lactamase regulating signal transducer with metallopeptidase domain [Paenibacillus silagei]
MVYGWFAGIAEQTLAASMVILAVLVIQYVLRRFINARVRYLLWLLVIARLLLPAVPDSPVSMLHILGNSKHLLTTILDKGPDIGASQGEYQELPPGEGAKTTYPANSTVLNEVAQTGPIEQNDESAAVNRSSAGAAGYPLWMKIGTVIWLLGVMLMLLNGLLYIRRMHRERRRLRRVSAPEILKVVLTTRRQFGIRRAIPVYTGGSANNPYLSGLMRPWIFVPEQALRELDASRLRHILAHELAHCKRRDMLWNLLGSLAATIHWFNPLMWLAIRRMKIDREVACDAYVLEVLGEEEAIDYGLTLVEFLKRFSRVRERRGHLYFSNPQQRQQIRRRISMIQSFKKGSYRVSAAAVILVALLSVVTLTGASREPVKSAATGTKANPAGTLAESVPGEERAEPGMEQGETLVPLTSIDAQQTEYAIRHNLLVPMNVEIEQDGYQVTVTGFMADKNQFLIFYTARVDGGRSLFSGDPRFVECIITDGITGKVINGRTHALVSSSSPEPHIKDAVARLPFDTNLTDVPSKIKVEFRLRSVVAGGTKIQESPTLQTTFDVSADYWKQEKYTIQSKETLDVGGHKIRVKLQLTPLTTIATFYSDEPLFKNKEFMKSFHEKYGSPFLWWSKTGTGDYRQQPGTSPITFTDYEMKMVTESYYLLDKLQSLRLDFMKSPAKPTGMKDLEHTYQMTFDVPGQDQS